MKRINFLLIAVAFIIVISCSKKGSSGGNSNFWNVHYEITSTNPLTKVALTYTDSSGTEVTIGDLADTSSFVSLPWTYNAEFSKDASAIGARYLVLGVFGSTPLPAGDKITVKIYVDGSVVAQSDEPAFGSITVTYKLH